MTPLRDAQPRTGEDRMGHFESSIAWDDVPSRLKSLCRRVHSEIFIQLDKAGVISNADLAVLAKAGVGLQIFPEADFDLLDVSEPLAAFRYVELVATRWKYENVAVLERAVRLEMLMAHIDWEPVVDLSRLPRLHIAALTGHAALTALQNPALREASVMVSDIPSTLHTAARLTSLYLLDATRVQNLSFLDDVSELTQVYISGARSLDIAALAGAARLKDAVFRGCRELVNIEALLEIPDLEYLEITGARKIPGFESVAELRRTALQIENNYVFDDNFRSKVAKQGREPGGHVYIDPYKQPKLVPPAVGTKAKMVDGIDATTFDPFEVHYEDRQYEVVFTDWSALGETLAGIARSETAAMGEELALRVLRKDAPDLLQEGQTQFDSDTEEVLIRCANRATAERTAQVLCVAWQNRRRMRALARSIIKANFL